MDYKIKRIYITRDEVEEAYSTDKLFIFYDENEAGRLQKGPVKEDFIATTRAAEIRQFLAQNGVVIETEEQIQSGLLYAIEQGIITIYTRPSDIKEIDELEKEYNEEVERWKAETSLVPVPVPEPEVEEKKKGINWKKVTAFGLATAALIGGLHLFHSCEEDDTQNEVDRNTELEKLYDKLTDDQRTFFNGARDFATNFNQLATKNGNFKLAKDGNIELKMSFAEAIALNISINDYSAEEMYEIFGILGLDAENITALRNSAYEKLTAYYMNAKEPSGVASMIRNPEARVFYEDQEAAVIAFNNNPSQELADKMIATTYANYLNVNEGGSVLMNESLILGRGTSAMAKAAYMASTTVQGYMLANRNVSEYLTDSNTGTILTSLKTEKDGTIQSVGVMDIINDANLCNDLNESLTDLIEYYNDKLESIYTNEQARLITSLSDKAANIVRSEGYDATALQKAASVSGADAVAIDRYGDSLEAYRVRGEITQDYITAQNEAVGDIKQPDVAALINNRSRTRESVKVETSEGEVSIGIVGETSDGEKVYDPKDVTDENGNLNDKGKKVAEQQGTVTEEVSHTETEVSKKDLTEEEQHETQKQEEELRIIDYTGNTPVEAEKSASTYTTTKGIYHTDEVLVDANGTEISLDDETIFNIAYMTAAYTDKSLTYDEQMVKQCVTDASEFEAQLKSMGVTDTGKYVAQFKSSWESTVKEQITRATTLGDAEQQRLAEANEAIKKANNALENGNSSEAEKIISNIPGIEINDKEEETSKASVYDPETDSSRIGEGEVTNAGLGAEAIDYAAVYNSLFNTTGAGEHVAEYSGSDQKGPFGKS